MTMESAEMSVGHRLMMVSSRAPPMPRAMPNEAASGTEGDGFDEELEEDVAATRADGHADADLARPLGDADEHDVHDADAANDERDDGDAGEQGGHGVHRRGLGFGDFLLVAQDEVIVAALLDAVPLPEQVGDAVLDLDDLLGGGGLHVDGAEHGHAGEALHAGGVRHDDDVVLIGAEHGSAFGFENAEDFDGYVLDADGLADGVFIGKETVGDRLAEDANLGGARMSESENMTPSSRSHWRMVR